MSDYTFNNPVRIEFGVGSLDRLNKLVGGREVALITTQGAVQRGLVGRIERILEKSIKALFAETDSNPSFDTAKDAYRSIGNHSFDLVIGLGGGSSLDLAKVVATMRAGGGEEWLDAHLREKTPFPANFNPVPVIAIPTTAGSGSEVTMWASIWDRKEKKKYSVSHRALYPEVALCDSELAITLPERETASTSLDALSHAVESVWNKNRNPVSEALALGAIRTIRIALPQIKNRYDDLDLRGRLLSASVMAGMAISNTQTALAHCISYPLTSIHGIPHGIACALPLPWLLSLNESGAPGTVKVLSEAFGCAADVSAIEEAFFSLFNAAGIDARLSSHGVDSNGIDAIVDRIFEADRFGNNVAPVDRPLIHSLIRDML